MNRVWELVSAERRRLERQRYEEEREAQLQAQAQARQPKASAPVDGDIKDQANGDSTSEVNVDTLAGTPPSATAVPPTDKPAPTGPMPEIERGLCVVCQDEEATLAVVDCGHLCMCAREWLHLHPSTGGFSFVLGYRCRIRSRLRSEAQDVFFLIDVVA